MLKLDSISFRYGRVDLFKNLSLNLEPGNIYGLLGKNGAGKTTLLKIMGGLLFCADGVCFFDDCDTSKREPEFLEDVFFLPEEFFMPSIKGELFLKLRAAFYPGFDYSLFKEFIGEFDIPMDKALNTLSFGQKKKFLLSFGLATGTRLIIMDEPTNGLDIPSKTILRKIIAKSMTKERIILISTHQVKDVENLIDPVIILDNGNIIFNRSSYNVSTALSMGKVGSLNGDEIYSQEVMGGYEVVTSNKDSDGGIVDLELLFNAVISDPDAINQCFQKGGTHE